MTMDLCSRCCGEYPSTSLTGGRCHPCSTVKSPAPAAAVADGFEISIHRVGDRWTATVSRRTDVAGPDAYRLRVIDVQVPTNAITTVLRAAAAAIANDLADAEPADFCDRPH